MFVFDLVLLELSVELDLVFHPRPTRLLLARPTGVGNTGRPNSECVRRE